ncbi:MAG: RES domain-containing protein [Actinomycetota bacterium]
MVPWLEWARHGELGHPLTIPAGQGGGRIDNPTHYKVLYAAGSPEAAFGEAFGNKSRWSNEMFSSMRSHARRCVVELEIDGKVLDLDDASVLVKHQLRPSTIATPERSVTQQWALRIFRLKRWHGLRWWSIRDSRWSIYGLWTPKAKVISVSKLTLDHPAAIRAAEMLGRTISD